jgi:PAS domain S-box-containing protein
VGKKKRTTTKRKLPAATAEISALPRSDMLEHILVHSPAIAFLCSSATGWPVEFITDNICQFGYSASEIMKSKGKLVDMVHPDDAPRLAREIQARIKQKQDNFSVILRMFDEGGNTHWVDTHVWLHQGDKKKAAHYHGIILDITDRKLLEDVLDKEKFFINNVFINSVDGMAIATRAGEFIAINPAVWRLFHCQPGNIRTVGDLLAIVFGDAELRQKIRSRWDRDVTRDHPPARIFPATLPDGNRRWFRFQMSPMGEEHVLLTCQDITETKEKEEELRTARGELEKLVAERTRELTKANERLRAEIKKRARP